jgi:hypothetical protein
VDTIFKHPKDKPYPRDKDLGYIINISIRNVKIIKDRRIADDNVRINDASESLRLIQRYCSARWEPDQDHSIYLTRKAFGPAGFAPVQGMCNPDDSHTLCKEDGFNSAFVIAHETGHVLGMEHDGDEHNSCSDARTMGSIMAPTVESNFRRYFWSRCSKNYLNQYIRTYTCLNNNPGHGRKIPISGSSNKYTLDEQCRLDFGKDYGLCQNIQDQCSTLWCSTPANPQFCKTKRQPPLDGTECKGPSASKRYECFKGIRLTL